MYFSSCVFDKKHAEQLIYKINVGHKTELVWGR